MLLISTGTHLSKSHKQSIFTSSHMRIVVFALLAMQHYVLADGCNTYYQVNGDASCVLCQYKTKNTCAITPKTNSELSCIEQCCNIASFPKSYQSSLCNPEQEQQTTITISTVFMIIFFIIPAVICLICCLSSCCKRYRRRQYSTNQNNEPAVSASTINLGDYNIDELGPFYQDVTQTCSICLENGCNIRTKCGHSFHSECLKTWISKKQSCPFCVSREINPILLYCKSCWKQSRLAVLQGRMSIDEQIQWQAYIEHKCQLCVDNNKNQEVSLVIEISQQVMKKQQEPKGEAGPVVQIQASNQ